MGTGNSLQVGIQPEAEIPEAGPEEVHTLGIHPGAGLLEDHLEVQSPEARPEGTRGVHLEVGTLEVDTQEEGQPQQQQKYSRRSYWLAEYAAAEHS